MYPDVCLLISMSLCRDGEENETEGNAPDADRPSARVCTTNLLPAVFYVFRFYVRSGRVSARVFRGQGWVGRVA